jgi:hypothetical protein
LSENVINLVNQKVAQNVTISLGYFIFSKNCNEPPTVAQLAKNHPIWSPRCLAYLKEAGGVCKLVRLVEISCFSEQKGAIFYWSGATIYFFVLRRY